MRQIRLVDGAFPTAKSMSAKGENVNLSPQYFEWYRGENYRDICFFTDSTFHLASNTDAKKKIAWLLEPPPFRQDMYNYVFSNMNQFDYVLTYTRKYIDNDKILFYPYGGSMIKEWEIYPKTKLCSMIVSEKNESTGHRLRHKIVKRFGNRFDILGSGYGPYIDKRQGLQDYAFSVVVLGERLDYCFDEKFLDCLALGTVPIFWGCPNIKRFFGKKAILEFDELDKLDSILESLSFELYLTMFKTIQYNIKIAKGYICVEDWLFNQYPFLFEVGI